MECLTIVRFCCSDSVGVYEGLSSSSQPGGVQSAWTVSPGQVSMADIVKMGRPQPKTSVPNSSAASHHNLNVPETNNDRGFVVNTNVQQNDEWPSIEHPPTVSVSSVVDAHPNSEYYTDSSNFGEANRQLENHVNEFVAEEVHVENENLDDVGSASIPAKIISDDNPGSASAYDDSLYKDINSYQSHRHPFDDNEGEPDAS
jgi:hypothetical protein